MLERNGVACGIRIAGDIDRIGARPNRRQGGIQLLHGGRGNVGRISAEIGEAVDCENADAAAIGEDRQPLARQSRQVSERFGSGKQLVEIEHA